MDRSRYSLCRERNAFTLIELLGAAHTDRFNAVFTDGSVRSISDGIDPTVFRNIGNKSDGKVISFSDL